MPQESWILDLLDRLPEEPRTAPAQHRPLKKLKSILTQNHNEIKTPTHKELSWRFLEHRVCTDWVFPSEEGRSLSRLCRLLEENTVIAVRTLIAEQVYLVETGAKSVYACFWHTGAVIQELALDGGLQSLSPSETSISPESVAAFFQSPWREYLKRTKRDPVQGRIWSAHEDYPHGIHRRVAVKPDALRVAQQFLLGRVQDISHEEVMHCGKISQGGIGIGGGFQKASNLNDTVTGNPPLPSQKGQNLNHHSHPRIPLKQPHWTVVPSFYVDDADFCPNLHPHLSTIQTRDAAHVLYVLRGTGDGVGEAEETGGEGVAWMWQGILGCSASGRPLPSLPPSLRAYFTTEE